MMLISKWKGVAATEAFNGFIADRGNFVHIESGTLFLLQIPLIIDRVRHFEGFIFGLVWFGLLGFMAYQPL